MPSVITGFEYDIFISYRQKDNKGERWVSEFVDNLRTEIEATFKEDISIYFDENPHDRLLETHNVDKSLESKLKCLIFIPIISQTFCDPASFAWQNELLAFRKYAIGDKFGIDVKLKNGNIASRILPIRIHDMDRDDIRLFEDATGGIMRAIDFVFKTSSGVNRPLRYNEDHPNDNLNKTFYRDQINKVANAIKDIIQGLRLLESGQDVAAQGKKTENQRSESNLNKRIQFRHVLINLRNRNRIIIALTVLLISIGAFAVYALLFSPTADRLVKNHDKSIAVLSFLSYGSDDDQKDISDQLTSEIINHLYKIKSFDKVVPLISVLPYKGSDKKSSQIASELNVNYILEGTFRKAGPNVHITTTLIDPDDESIMWQNEYDEPYRDILTIQADIALQIAGQVKAFITASEKQNIRKIPTKNQEAYELIQHGLYLWNTRNFTNIDEMFDLTQKAKTLDPEYADAYAFAGLCLLLKTSVWGGSELQSVVWDASAYLEKALELDKDNCNAHLGMALFYDWIRWDFIKAEKELTKILELEPNNPQYLELYVEFLLKRNLPLEALKYKLSTEQSYRLIQADILAGRVNDALTSLRTYLGSYGARGEKYSGDCFLWMEKYDSARIHLEAAVISKDPDVVKPRFQAYLALAYSKTGREENAGKIIEKLTSYSKATTANSPEYFIGWYYAGTNKPDSAFIWLQKAYANRSTQLTWLKADPVFKNIKNDVRFRNLYQQTGHESFDKYLEIRK
jgi:TolB-like protein/Tfp pilus assembly protein PilF